MQVNRVSATNRFQNKKNDRIQATNFKQLIIKESVYDRAFFVINNQVEKTSKAINLAKPRLREIAKDVDIIIGYSGGGQSAPNEMWIKCKKINKDFSLLGELKHNTTFNHERIISSNDIDKPNLADLIVETAMKVKEDFHKEEPKNAVDMISNWAKKEFGFYFKK